jgi:hypothetical protein
MSVGPMVDQPTRVFAVDDDDCGGGDRVRRRRRAADCPALFVAFTVNV